MGRWIDPDGKIVTIRSSHDPLTAHALDVAKIFMNERYRTSAEVAKFVKDRHMLVSPGRTKASRAYAKRQKLGETRWYEVLRRGWIRVANSFSFQLWQSTSVTSAQMRAMFVIAENAEFVFIEQAGRPTMTLFADGYVRPTVESDFR